MSSFQALSRSRLAVAGALMATGVFVGCDAGSPDALETTRQETFFPPPPPAAGSCNSGDDCVSGVCRSGQCAICGTLDFQRDASERSIAPGHVVENLYSPVAIRAFKDPFRIERGLGVAFASAGHARIASQANVLISQASFTDADVVRGFVDDPLPQQGPSVFDFDFSEPVCADSFTFAALELNKFGHVDLFDSNGFPVFHQLIADTGGRQNVSLGVRCGVSRMSVTAHGKAAIDDVRVCGLGKSPPAPTLAPGRVCGVDVIQSVQGVLDPCVSGAVIATRKLRPLDLSGSLSLSVPENSTLCVRLTGDTKRVKRVSLDGSDLGASGDGVAPLEVRSATQAGSHSVAIDTSLGLWDVDVAVLASPGTFDGRIATRKRGVLLTNTDESPDSLELGSTTSLTATARVGRISLLGPYRLLYEFRIYEPGGCRRVRTIAGTKDVAVDVPAAIGGIWDGKDSQGQPVADGDYLWNVHISAIPLLNLAGRVDVTSGFRSIRVFGQVPASECRNQVRERILAANVPDPNSRFDVMRDLLRCGADDATACDIDFFSVVNLQRREVANQFFDDEISPAEHRRFSLDRTRKVAKSDDDPSWVVEFCTHGDADGDLVPDPRDRCPATPPLAATDDQGCTDTTLPDAPARDDVRTLFQNLRFSYAPGCPSDATPRGSRIVSACEDAAHTLHIVVEPEDSMPADCPVWYIVRGTADSVPGAVIPNPPGSPPLLFGIRKDYVGFALGPPQTPVVVPGGLEFRITAEQLRLPLGSNERIRNWGRLKFSVQTLTGAGHRSQVGPIMNVGVPSCP
jgi:hypothetical protein